jgi:hypothetical protein
MKKQEMSAVQLGRRTLVVERLAAAGWSPSSSAHELFDHGLWVTFEVEMEHQGHVRLGVMYRTDQEALWLQLAMPDGSEVELKVEVGEELSALLDVIVRFQDTITPDDYRTHIRSILAVCPKVHAVTPDERLVRLTDTRR